MKVFQNKNLYYYAIVIIFNIVLLFLPLVNLVGYEHSAINGILLFLISGLFLTIKYRKMKIDNIPFTEIIKENFLFYFLIFIIPLLIGSINTLANKCPLDDNILFYFVISLSSLFMGFSISYLIKINIKNYSIILFLLLFAILAIISFLEFYFYDQIFIYNPIVGFISGTIYDEYIPIPQKLILAQLIYFKLFLVFIIIKQKLKNFNDLTKILFNSFLFIFFALTYLLKPSLGLVTNESIIRNELPNIVENENYVIFLPENISKERKKIIELEHEYYFNELESKFNYKPKNKIRSIIFRDSQQKDKLFGSENANVAKIWGNTIYQTLDSYTHTLLHELVHIFSGEIGKGFLKLPDNYNFYLLEGLAMALENNFDNKPVHYAASLVIKKNQIKNINFVNKGSTFFLANVNQSYSIAGSFVKYLIDTYGMQKFIGIYQTSDYPKYYSKSFNELNKEYLNFINKINVDLIINEYQRYFSTPSLFKKSCARYIAKLNHKSNILLNNQQYQQAKIINEEIFNKTKNINSFSRLLFCYDKMFDFSGALDFINKNSNFFVDELSKNIILFNKAEFLVKANNVNESIKVYKQVNINTLPDNYKNIIKIRIELLDDPILLNNYVIGSNYDKYEILKVLNIENKLFKDTFDSILQLAKSLDVSPKSISDYYKNALEKYKNVDQTIWFNLSQYCLENELIEDAVYFSEISLLNLDNEMNKIIYNNNMKKIKWIYKVLNEN